MSRHPAFAWLLPGLTLAGWFVLTLVTFLPVAETPAAAMPPVRQPRAAELAAPAALPAPQLADESAVIAAYRRAAPAVVAIEVLRPLQLPPGHPPIDDLTQMSGRGSGFVFTADGLVATNAHVVNGATRIRLSFADGSSSEAGVVALDPARDLAVLAADRLPDGLVPLAFAAEDVLIGQSVLTIGAPFGEAGSLSLGVVAGLDRELGATAETPALYGLIQTDAVVNPGNSGGPLLNTAGDVVGMTTAIAVEAGGMSFAGVGYALPRTTLTRVLPALAGGTAPAAGWLGLQTLTIDVLFAENFALPVSSGVLVNAVAEGSPAALAGLRGGRIPDSFSGMPLMIGGDILVSLNGRPLTRRGQLEAWLMQNEVGAELTLGVLRDGAEVPMILRSVVRP